MLTTGDIQRRRFELMAREHVIRMGARIRERRDELGFSQGFVARQLPGTVDGNQVSRWERGIHKPGDDTLERLAGILDTTVAAFYMDAPADLPTPDLKIALGEPSQLTRVESQLQELREMVESVNARLAILALGQPEPTSGSTGTGAPSKLRRLEAG